MFQFVQGTESDGTSSDPVKNNCMNVNVHGDTRCEVRCASTLENRPKTATHMRQVRSETSIYRTGLDTF